MPSLQQQSLCKQQLLLHSLTPTVQTAPWLYHEQVNATMSKTTHSTNADAACNSRRGTNYDCLPATTAMVLV